MTRPDLLTLVQSELDDLKAIQVSTLDVRPLTALTDHMVIASGTSNRHVQALTENLVKNLKAAGHKPIREQRDTQGDWIVIDFGEVLIHIMHPRTRDFYNLEQLWQPQQPFETAVGA